MATTMTSRSATWSATRTSATSSATIAVAITSAAAGTSLAPAFWTRCARFYRRHHTIHPVEVGLIVGIEIRATLNYCRRY